MPLENFLGTIASYTLAITKGDFDVRVSDSILNVVLVRGHVLSKKSSGRVEDQAGGGGGEIEYVVINDNIL